MRKALLFGGGVALAAVLAVVGLQTHASSSTYPFLVRGIVTEVDGTAKTVRMYTTHTSGTAKDDLAGVNQDFNVGTAKLYKWVSGKKNRVTLGSVVVGDEVVIKGTKKGEGDYRAAWLVVNDRTFVAEGKLKRHDKDNRLLTVEITKSTYSQARFLGKDVIMKYDDNTQFHSLGKLINHDELNAGDQKVRVTGKVVNSNQWEVTKLHENIK